MKSYVLFFVSMVLLSPLAAKANENIRPDMEQEILRQLEQIKTMGKKWNKKPEESQPPLESASSHKKDDKQPR
jgi:sensor domain CHASE-containing protein